MRRIIFALSCLVLSGPTAKACDEHTPCTTTHGSYLIRLPANWDGKTPLPAAMFFNGYRSTAADTMGDAALGKVFSDAGYLLIAPDPLGPAWAFGNRAAPRDDFAFTREVVADVQRRFPIDKSRFLATGFSLGASMIWYVACKDGGLFSAYASFSGTFWKPEPQSCATGPVNLRHVHGTADQMMPMQGRALNTPTGPLHQGDVLTGFATWRRMDACTAAPARTEIRDGMMCQVWPAKSCTGGHELQLCLHPNGHELRAEWMAAAVHWADGLPRSP